MKTYDVLVLGGGTAGTAAAKAAHEAGATTAMFNEGELGGLCILRGCMPTKTLLHSAHLVHEAQHHTTPGVGNASLEVDFAAIMANKDTKVARFQKAKIQSIERGGYEVIDARARFSGPDTVEAGGETYRFTKGAVLATGSIQHVPDIPGLVEVGYLDSDKLMRIEQAPHSAVVIGSGAIGLEFAQFFARLGTEIHVVARRKIFADIDPEVSEEMRKVFEDDPNMTLHDEHRTIAIRRIDGGVQVEIEGAEGRRKIAVEHVILATGRAADVANMGLKEAGIETDGLMIKADPHMRTTNPRVFVAGDATGTRQLLHVANWEGAVAGRGAAQVAGDHLVEERLNVSVVFFDPPLATAGESAAEAEARGVDVITSSARFAETGRAITMDVAHGVFKLVADRATGEILGAQILGPRADDLIHTISTLMYYRGTAKQMLEMPWYHPTLSEVLLSLARDLESQRSV